MSDSDFIQLHTTEVKWHPGIIFSAEKDHTSGAYWLIEEVNGGILTYSHPNRPAYGKNKCPITSLGHHKYYFVKKTLQPIDPQVTVINKIKYLDKRFLDRQQKEVTF